MAPMLDDLINDRRLTRLFSNDARHCALQLWILQVKSKESIENRIVYGRLLPYSHSDDCWYASDADDFKPFGHVQAQVVRLNLYVKSKHCSELLRRLCAGDAVAAISAALNLALSAKLEARLGEAALGNDGLVYRPVTYLLNRDAHDRLSPSSPHHGAGAFCASITQSRKEALFRVGQDYDVALTASVVEHLNDDTGMDFGGVDSARCGDLELLVFPALDDLERSLLSVSWAEAPCALVARFDPTQVPHYSGFQFRLSVVNNAQIAYAAVRTAERDAKGVFECRFDLGEQLRAMTDSTELEIFGFNGDHCREGALCCRWRMGYVREIHLQGHVVDRGSNSVKFDWLAKATRPSMSARVDAATTINRGNRGFANQVGGREADPWVPANRDLASLFARLHPPKSEGQFYLRWNQGDGEGRLQFVEWFRALLAKHHQHQVIIFDPYFETAGLGLVLICAAHDADCVVFRSLPKVPSTQDVAAQGEPNHPPPSGVDNLVANCERNREPLRRIKLRIYGLKEGRLHDRYILVMGSDGLPVEGFHLSNSFQTAAQNFPLLVTPIPADILLRVERYELDLAQEAAGAQPGDNAGPPAMRLLFDSTASQAEAQRYEPLRFLETALAGHVLNVWIGEPSLEGLSGDPLKTRMTAMGLLKGNSLALPEAAGLRSCLDYQAGNFTDFTATWEVLGELLAHSSVGDSRFREIKSAIGFLQFLAQFLKASFNRAYDQVDKELAMVDAEFFRKPVETLLYSAYRPEQLFYPTKHTALTWPEYFAIRFLWWYAPDTLLAIAEAQMASLPTEPRGSDTVRLSLLSQIVSEISLSIQLDISEVQRGLLIRSSNSLLQWMGLYAIERQLEKPEGLAPVLQWVTTFTHPKQVQTLGWMVHHAAEDPKKANIYTGLVAALHEALPATIPAEDLVQLVDSMRGHMRRLTWAEPWLFKDVVFPLLRDGRAKYDDACEIWIQELTALLGPQPKRQPRLFDRVREGQTTNVAAFLFAYSSAKQQQASLKSMQKILKLQRRVAQQPLASSANWARWDDALKVSMWILTFTRWCQYYLRERGMTDSALEKLSESASALAMVRPMEEWRSEVAGKQGELAAFLDQVQGLLTT